MSWYFFGGFSAYAMVPSARVVNHSGCAATHGWSGEHCSARSSATSIPSSRARATKASKSANVPSSGCIASWPPATDPVPYGEPGSVGRQVSELLRPLRLVVPMGWLGGRYTTSKPISAIAGSRSAAVCRVPEVHLLVRLLYSAPSERGKNSYHEPYSARSRSTRSG